jgi:hypothetical protein
LELRDFDNGTQAAEGATMWEARKDPVDQRRAFLKELAARSARQWSATPLPATFLGETRIETRNTCYSLLDGVCYAVTRHQGAGEGPRAPSEYVGMRIVGWLMRDAPRQGIAHAWQPGAYAVLWRPREGDEAHSAVALTSATSAFRVAPQPNPQALTTRPGGRRLSTPPPLPLGIPRGTLLPRPPTPASWVPPPPASMTRLHLNNEQAPPEIPPPPDTPTPPRRSSVPPPLPARARVHKPTAPRLRLFS